MKKLHRQLITLLVFLGWLSVGAVVPGPSGTLPILHIDTKNGQVIDSKENYVDATFWLETLGVADMGENIGTAEKPLALQIRGRGNFTWAAFDKKPYRLKLGKKAAMLGLDSSKHWALLAHADDSQGFLRNAVGFQLSRQIGLPWTPGDKPCEVVLNGEYIGLYFLTETVRVDKKRVNVSNGDDEVEDWLEANPDKTAADYPYTELDNTGGWLVEVDNTDDKDQIRISSRNPRRDFMRVTYDTPSDYITQSQIDWLATEFKTLDDLIYDRKDWTGKIDLDCAAKFFIVNQLMGNYESYSGSFKLSRERGEAEKWKFGPVWDFGSGFQNPGAMSRWIWDGVYSQYWVDAMWELPAYQARVKVLYGEFMENGNMARLGAYIDRFAEQISSAAHADYERWGEKGYGNDDMMEKVNSVKYLLNQSVKFMNGKMGYEGEDQPYGPLQYYDWDKIGIFLRGSINGWEPKDEYRFVYSGENGVFTLNIPELSGEFKLSDSDWSFNKGYGMSPKIFPIGSVNELTDGGANILVDGRLVNVTLTLDAENNTLKIIGEDGQEGPDEYADMEIYLRGELNGWDATDAHQFQYTGADGVFVLALESLSGVFKIADSHWTFDKGYGEKGSQKEFVIGQEVKLTDKGENITIGKPLSDVTLVLDVKNNTLKVSTISAIPEIDADDTETAVEYYNLQGIRIDKPERGLYIMRRGDKIVKVLIAH